MFLFPFLDHPLPCSGLVSVIAALDWFSGWRHSKEGSLSVKCCNLPTTLEWSPIPLKAPLLSNVHGAGFMLHWCWARSMTDVGNMAVVSEQQKIKLLVVWYHCVLCILRCRHKTRHYFMDHLQSQWTQCIVTP